MGTLWRAYVKVHEPSELWFGVMCALGHGIAVLDGGGPHRASGRGRLGGVVPCSSPTWHS